MRCEDWFWEGFRRNAAEGAGSLDSVMESPERVVQSKRGRDSEGARRILNGSNYIAESREMEKKDESARAGACAAGAI